MEELDLVEFEELFEADLDSWFSADIKCCDKCYDDFMSEWPNVKLRSADCYPVDLVNFYEGGKRLRHIYTKEQYLEGIESLYCPRCGANFKNNEIYPFEFVFDPPDDFEYKAYELKNIINETPFIVLKNELATETFNLIEKIFNAIEPVSIKDTFFRGRIIDHRDAIGLDFLAPPRNVTKDGRYNHIGVPVIYSANNKDTCYNELRKPENDLWISEFTINDDLKLLDLNEIEDYSADGNLLQAIVWSSLTSAKTKDDDWHKPEYHFTRFISDCCKYLGFDGIKYPSVQIGSGHNYVFFEKNLLTEEKIKKIYKYKKTNAQHRV